MPPDQSDQTESDRALHERLLARDPTASVDLCERYLERLHQALARQFSTTNLEIVHDAVIDATLDYIEHPERYDPGKRSLFGYLFMAARGDILNLRRRHRVWIEEEPIGDDVEIDDLVRNTDTEADDLAEEVVDAIVVAGLVRDAMSVAYDEEERAVLRLMMDGARSTSDFATALGWGDLPFAEQKSRVYKVKDRLSQRLKRLRDRDGRD